MRKSLASSEKVSDVRRRYVCVVGHTVVMTSPLLEQSGDGPLKKYRRVLSEKVNVTSNNRGLPKNNHSVANYDQVKKGLSYFYTKRIVDSDGIHTQVIIL